MNKLSLFLLLLRETLLTIYKSFAKKFEIQYQEINVKQQFSFCNHGNETKSYQTVNKLL